MTCNSDGQWSSQGLARFRLYSCTLNCGLPNLGELSTFIINGTVAHHKDWPWHATIFARPGSNREFLYICGGSLIKPHGAKEFLILTAAQCVTRTAHSIRNVKDVMVVLGSQESTLGDVRSHSPDAQVYHVKKIVIHDSFDGHRSAYQSDIAIMRLVEPVRLSPNILPICLSKSAGRPTVGNLGHIAGFGFHELGSDLISRHLRRTSLPVVDADKCSEWRTRKLNVQEFCAGTDNKQNACNGDSGGGMVFNGTDTSGQSRFYLQGIVSHGRGEWNGKPQACDSFTVFTRVTSYTDWIYE